VCFFRGFSGVFRINAFSHEILFMTSTVDPFGARLRALRLRAGLSQHKLAVLAGLTRDGLAKLEAGRGQPRWQTVQALADALGVSLDDFRKRR
jgi:DNA-binding XRE family transcriptional regulator